MKRKDAKKREKERVKSQAGAKEFPNTGLLPTYLISVWGVYSDRLSSKGVIDVRVSSP